jgi:hypothetical protein
MRHQQLAAALSTKPPVLLLLLLLLLLRCCGLVGCHPPAEGEDGVPGVDGGQVLDPVAVRRPARQHTQTTVLASGHITGNAKQGDR